MKGLSLQDVIRWLLSGALQRTSLVALLTSPLAVFLWSALPLPWEPRFADSGPMGPMMLALGVTVLVLVLVLSLFIEPKPPGSEPVSKLPRLVASLAAVTAGSFLLLVGMVGYTKYFQKSLTVKWPSLVSTYDTLVGGTFRNIDFGKERVILYTCTKVRDRSVANTPWIDRCWLDQHPPDTEKSDGLWQTSCRFGNEDCADMDIHNPKFDVIPVLVRKDLTSDEFLVRVDRDSATWSDELRGKKGVSLVGPTFQVQRICTGRSLPHFTTIKDRLRDLNLGAPPEIHYSLCPDGVVGWGSAPGATTTPTYEIYFDGKRVDIGNGISLRIADLLKPRHDPARQPAINEEQWRRGELLELKISHDPTAQQYRNMYLYWDHNCITSDPPTRPASTGSL